MAGNEIAERRRVLVSAFACSPLWGSEPEVGWRWMLQISRLHDVVLITHGYFRSHLERVLPNMGASVEVHYFDAPSFGLHPHTQLTSRAYYIWWQVCVRRMAASLLDTRRFDLVHHITWGTIRFPCFLGGLGVPLVMGPLGGGERAPRRLYEGLPLRYRVFDELRSLSLKWIRLDPLATWGPRRAAFVLCRTEESLRCLPKSVQSKAAVVPDIGSPPVDLSQRRPVEEIDTSSGLSSRPHKLLFAGRLLGWKGVMLALGAVEKLVQSAQCDVQLDIVGDGPLRPLLQREIEKKGLGGRVRLFGAIPRDDLLTLYAKADLFVFPSLHDAGGTVVLEALSRGLPVICLDLGGPPNFVDARSGVVVRARGRSRNEVEQALAQAVAQALGEPGRLHRLSLGAAEHARQQSWENLVHRAYTLVHRRLGWEAVSS